MSAAAAVHSEEIVVSICSARMDGLIYPSCCRRKEKKKRERDHLILPHIPEASWGQIS